MRIEPFLNLLLTEDHNYNSSAVSYSQGRALWGRYFDIFASQLHQSLSRNHTSYITTPGVFQLNRRIKKIKTKTYNSWDSHVVTHHTTNQPACGLSTAERTGSPVFHTLWSYVLDSVKQQLIYAIVR